MNTPQTPNCVNRVLAPVRVQRSRAKGFKLQNASPNRLPVIYVGRPTKFGNPFKLTPDGWILYYKTGKIVGDPWCYWSVCGGFSIEDIVNLYEQWIKGEFKQSCLPTPPDYSILKGKNLSCFCSIVKPCHADVLLRLSNC
jgi:hypothetical protein